MINISDRNGRALEYCVTLELSKLDNFHLSTDSVSMNYRDQGKFSDLPNPLKAKFEAASISIKNWLSSSLDAKHEYTINRLNDSASNPADIEVFSKSNKISLSLKHNSVALKHPRPYSLAQFCGFSKGSNEDISHRNNMSIAENNFRRVTKGISLYSENSSAVNQLYSEVCEVCKTSLLDWNTKHGTIAKDLFLFLVSNGFYKVIVDTTSTTSVVVQDYTNLKTPSDFSCIAKNNRLIISFNNDWIINLRVHTASSRVSNIGSQLSLKFDAQKTSGIIHQKII